MIKKTLQIIKENPVIIVLYAVFVGLNIFMSQFMDGIDRMALNPQWIEVAVSKMLGMWIIIMIVFILFMGGYGNMLATAIKTGKCTLKDFLRGLNYFLGRMLWAFVLVFLLAMLFFLIVIVAAFPILMASSVGGIRNLGLLAALLTAGAGVFAVFIYPAIMLWYPAIFIDDTGVIEGLKRGVTASRKCYLKLAVTTFVSILPSTLYTTITSIISGASYGRVEMGVTAGYMVSIAVSVVISFFIFVYLFVIYDRKRGI